MINYYLQKTYLRIRRLYGRWLVANQGWSVFDDLDRWDVVFLLDGCRFDTFKKVNHLPGRLKCQISRGSCTPEWFRASIPAKPLKKLIYISANPFISDFYLQKWGKKNWFGHLEPVWDYGWDKKLKTVSAQTVLRAFLKLFRQQPQKKFFVHLMQPHHPFIGKKKIKEDGWEISRDIVKGLKKTERKANIYDLWQQKKVTKEQVVRAYEDNLRYVLAEIEKILPQLKNKKILLTSDHGNLFGEYALISHPKQTLVPELIRVPHFSWQPN